MKVPEIKLGAIHEPGSEMYEDICSVADAMNSAIPPNTACTHVYGAIGSMLVIGLRHSFRDPERRLASFDEWVAFHRALLTEGCN